jgi:hypothetical protein
MNSTIKIFGVSVNTTLYFAVMGFVLWKFGIKYFAGLAVLYAVSAKSDATTTGTGGTIANSKINPDFQNNVNTAPAPNVVTPTLALLPSSFGASAIANTYSSVLTTTGAWTASAVDNWLSVSPASGAGKYAQCLSVGCGCCEL